MEKLLFGEFMGTFILILMGNGAVAAAVLRQSKAENAGWVSITAGWCFGVMCGIFTANACGSPDAHLNPAVTLAAALSSGDFSKFFPYLAAQLAGAMCGALLVWLFYYPFWRVTPEPETKRACFCTAPAIRHFPSNLLSEIVGTFVLVMVSSAMAAKTVAPTGVAPGLAPVLVGTLVWGIGLSLGATTGYAINPARDLGPRIMHALLPVAKKGDSDWGYAPVPFFGPLLGGALAGLFVKLVF